MIIAFFDTRWSRAWSQWFRDVELGKYNNWSLVYNTSFKNQKSQLSSNAHSTSTQLTNKFLNDSHLKFGSTWACTYEIELHVDSIREDAIAPWDIPSLQELSVTQFDSCNYLHCIKRNRTECMKSYQNRIHFTSYEIVVKKYSLFPVREK